MIDILFAVGSACFAAALLPSIFGQHKPAMWTSVMTGAWLWVFMGCYLDLELVYAAATTALTALEWTILAFQSWRNITKPALDSQITIC